MAEVKQNFYERNKKIIDTAALFGLGYLLVKPLFSGVADALGINNPNTNANNTALNNPLVADAWNPNYWKQVQALGQGVWVNDDSDVDIMVDDIYHSLAGLFDNDSAIIGIFQNLQYKTQVSYLADKFNQKQNRSLYSWLLNGRGTSPASGMSTNNLAIVNDLVSKMKNK